MTQHENQQVATMQDLLAVSKTDTLTVTFDGQTATLTPNSDEEDTGYTLSMQQGDMTPHLTKQVQSLEDADLAMRELPFPYPTRWEVVAAKRKKS